MVAQKVLGDADILIRKVVRIGGLDFFVLMRLAQVDAVERTIDGNFPLGAATKRADLAAHAGAEPLGAACVTDRAGHFHSIEEGGTCPLRICSSKWKSSLRRVKRRRSWAGRSAARF